MEIVDNNTFFDIIEKFAVVPFNQTKEWLLHAYKGEIDHIVFFVDSATNAHIACWGYYHKLRVIGNKLMIDGICKSNDLTSEDIRYFFNGILHSGYDMVFVSDIDEYSPGFEVGMRRAGFTRPIAFQRCPMSMIVDLQKPFNFHRNWKRSVKKSIDAGNSFTVIENPTLEDAKVFVKLFAELKERKHLNFDLAPSDLMRLFEGNFKLSFVYSGDTIICGRINYSYRGSVYDVYAANSDIAIKTGAAYHIQQGVLQYFRDCNCSSFDYGRISPSADKMDNIFLAKSYSGGKPIGYNGEWYFGKNMVISYIYSFYRNCICHSRIY